MDVRRRVAASSITLATAFLATDVVAAQDSPAPRASGSANPPSTSGPAASGAATPASTAAPAVSASASAASASPPVATPRSASAPSESAAADALVHIVDRPHTIAELEAGIIALPSAPISARVGGGDTPIGTIGRGDATVQIGIHVLYRWSKRFAIGAGALFAPLPTADDQYDLRSLPRTHSRSYFFLGAEGRYIPLRYKYAEGWVGVSVGGVVVGDRFSTDAGDRVPAILGTKQVTIRTEGFAFGLQAGGSYYLSENWILGATFRGYQWILPQSPRCSPIGDCASLSGAVLALELGLTIGYRLPL